MLQADLEYSIPSSTGAPAHHTSSGGVDASRSHARSLRVLLEKLDDLMNARAELVAKVNRLTTADDITPRVLKAASAMEQWVNVQPAMFEDILDEELSKFDKFRRQLEDDAQKQGELLEAVRVSRACAAWWSRNKRRLGLTDRHLYSLLLLVWFSPGVM